MGNALQAIVDDDQMLRLVELEEKARALADENERRRRELADWSASEAARRAAAAQQPDAHVNKLIDKWSRGERQQRSELQEARAS